MTYGYSTLFHWFSCSVRLSGLIYFLQLLHCSLSRVCFFSIRIAHLLCMLRQTALRGYSEGGEYQFFSCSANACTSHCCRPTMSLRGALRTGLLNYRRQIICSKRTSLRERK